MTLDEYLKLNSVSFRGFAKLVSVDHSAIFRYAKGKATPSLKVALKIVEVTEGMVKIETLLCD